MKVKDENNGISLDYGRSEHIETNHRVFELSTNAAKQHKPEVVSPVVAKFFFAVQQSRSKKILLEDRTLWRRRQLNWDIKITY